MIQNTEFVVFDFDGVLADTVSAWFALVADALTRVGADVDIDTLLNKYRGDNLAKSVPALEADYGIKLPSGWAKMVIERAASEVYQQVSPIAGAVDAVSAVAQAGLPLAVASGSPRSFVNIGLVALSLDHVVEDRVLSSHDDGRHKPDPGVYIRASQFLGFEPRQGLAIEDSVAGVQSAKSAGMPVIGYAPDTDGQRLVDAGAVLTIDHMAELVGVLSTFPERIHAPHRK